MTFPTNIGILAHIDAGKTSLTECLLFQAGVNRTIGSVDKGTTQTDSMALERQRGITIRSAVATFAIGDRPFNLIDTPGHPDFIAEVERAIGVLDAVILVVSAVEGVQPQTRRLNRAIQRLGLPCLVFINKIDRMGADVARTVEHITSELGRRPLLLTDATATGTSEALSTLRDLRDEALIANLAEVDDDTFAAWAEGDAMSRTFVWQRIAEATMAGSLTPVLCGSAMTGAGIDDLVSVLPRLVRNFDTDDVDVLSAEVFKVERNDRHERRVWCRMWSGSLAVRDAVVVATAAEDTSEAEKVTGLEVHRGGQVLTDVPALPGDVCQLAGLSRARIGDVLGIRVVDRQARFDPPVIERRIDPVDVSQRFVMRQGLAELVDEDPHVAVRGDERGEQVFVHLYGDVQQQVIGSLMEERFGVPVHFGEPVVLCVERLCGAGKAAEIFGETKPPFYATVGFEIQPMQGENPIWHYTPGKAKKGFFDAAEIGGRQTLEQGIYGWPVVDLDVEVTDLIFLVGGQAADYRRLATLVMADAIRAAGTVVCEPVLGVTIWLPPDSMVSVIGLITGRRGTVVDSRIEGERAVLETNLPAGELGHVHVMIPGMTNGRAELESRFLDYVPLDEPYPRRPRTDLNPFDRREYLARIAGAY